MTQAHTNHNDTDGHDHDEPHITPLPIYLGVWGALVVLTAFTVIVSRFDFGSANTIVAMIVATITGRRRILRHRLPASCLWQCSLPRR